VISEAQRRIIIETLESAVSPTAVYLFGSHNSGTARPDSDIDVAYIADRHLTPYERFTLAGQLAELLHTDVDLIDLSDASTVMQMQIVSQGSVIHCVNVPARQSFVLRTYKMYARLNEERQAILRKYTQGGAQL